MTIGGKRDGGIAIGADSAATTHTRDLRARERADDAEGRETVLFLKADDGSFGVSPEVAGHETFFGQVVVFGEESLQFGDLAVGTCVRRAAYEGGREVRAVAARSGAVVIRGLCRGEEWRCE